MRKYALIGAVLLVTLVLGITLQQPSEATARHNDSLTYKVRASNARLNRSVLGEVINEVQGVPAEPVHSFVWDGEGSVPIRGFAILEIDPVANTGEIRAHWWDRNGHWRLRQTAFAPPPHATGARLGSFTETVLVEDDPVVTDVYLHGDTTAGGPVLPTIFNAIATWGPAEVTLNGRPFENPFDGPAPLWVVHTMTTAGVRNDDGTVRTAEGDIYNPTLQAQPRDIDNDDREFHVVFHDAPGPEMTDNFPPPLSFFYHIMFEDVRVEIRHAE